MSERYANSITFSVLFVLARKLRGAGAPLVSDVLVPRAEEAFRSNPREFAQIVVPFLHRLGAESEARAMQNPKLGSTGLNTGLRPLVLLAINQISSQFLVELMGEIQVTEDTNWSFSFLVDCDLKCCDCTSINEFLR